MGVLYEVFVVEIESLQIRLHWTSSSRRKMGTGTGAKRASYFCPGSAGYNSGILYRFPGGAIDLGHNE